MGIAGRAAGGGAALLLPMCESAETAPMALVVGAGVWGFVDVMPPLADVSATRASPAPAAEAPSADPAATPAPAAAMADAAVGAGNEPEFVARSLASNGGISRSA